jgi:hypothetical protein
VVEEEEGGKEEDERRRKKRHGGRKRRQEEKEGGARGGGAEGEAPVLAAEGKEDDSDDENDNDGDKGEDEKGSEGRQLWGSQVLVNTDTGSFLLLLHYTLACHSPSPSPQLPQDKKRKVTESSQQKSHSCFKGRCGA